MHKFFSALLTTLAIAGSTHAQDKLNLRTGATIEAKVLEIGARDLTYKRFNNPTGPTYRVNKSEVASIQYENGSTEDFSKGNSTMRPALAYGRSVLSLAPIQFTDVTVRGVGLYYEKALDTRGILAVQVPVILSFPDYPNNNNGYRGVFTSIQPGLKIYPRGFAGAVRYAVGPSLVMGFGQRAYTAYAYDQVTGQTQYISVEEDVFRYGVMVNNSVNINASEHLYLGLEAGFGFKYTNTNNNYYGGSGFYGNYFYESPLLANFNFRIGYRF